MKRWILFAVVFLMGVPAALAAPTYGTKMPKANQAFWGLQTYTIFSQHLNKDQGDVRSQQEHILLSYGVTDWFSLDLKWSAGTVEHEANSGDKIKYNDPVWGGGYGFRLRLYESGPV